METMKYHLSYNIKMSETHKLALSIQAHLLRLHENMTTIGFVLWIYY